MDSQGPGQGGETYLPACLAAAAKISGARVANERPCAMHSADRHSKAPARTSSGRCAASLAVSRLCRLFTRLNSGRLSPTRYSLQMMAEASLLTCSSG